MRPEYPKQLLSVLALLAWGQPAAVPAEAQPVASATQEVPAAGEPGLARTETRADLVRADLAQGCPEILVRSTPALLFVDGFESGDTSAWSTKAAARLSARRILDLEFEVRLDPGLIGDHLLRLELETPKGHLYQRLTVPFSSSPAAAMTRSVAGHPRPLAVQVATARGRGAAPAVSFSFPVAGTPIVHSSLYGPWRARPFLDDSTTPCGDAKDFVLTP